MNPTTALRRIERFDVIVGWFRSCATTQARQVSTVPIPFPWLVAHERVHAAA
ncbi:MAG: hypothetical protein JRI23_07335 [Deltaproteobacteria bacterium]|nr:hypothetical protein [Deltaproteobacteria bacterium]MBW2531406.1 hypothetical protein [Deltaproteobacteria bacterium]